MPSSGVKKCALDRKSTRLNSSHTIISYAVFCLKKKNKEYATSLLQSSMHPRLAPSPMRTDSGRARTLSRRVSIAAEPELGPRAKDCTTRQEWEYHSIRPVPSRARDQLA